MMKASIVMCLAVALVTCAKALPARRRQQYQPYWPNYNQQQQWWNPNWGQGQDGGDQQEAYEQQFQEQEQEMFEQQEQFEQAEAGDGQWYQWNQQQWPSLYPQWPNRNPQWPSYQQQPNYQQQRPGYDQEAMEMQEQTDQQEAMDLQDRDRREAKGLRHVRDAPEPQEQTAAGGDTSEESNEEVESESFSSPSDSQLSAGPFSAI